MTGRPMTHWTYDPAIDAAYIQISTREHPNGVKTMDLTGVAIIQVDVDLDGNVLGMELIGGTQDISLRDLKQYLKEEPE